MNVLEQVKLFDSGAFSDKSVKTQIEAGWYDWFCKKESLPNKTIALYKKVKSVLKANEKGKRFDPEKVYVFFKNNCPIYGHSYDSFSLVDMKTESVIYWVTPRSGHSNDNHEAQVFSLENGFNEPVASGSWEDVTKYFRGE